MEEKTLEVLQAIKKELQDIRSILEPMETKITIDDEVIATKVFNHLKSSTVTMTQGGLKIKV